jgi:hypothetical protein
MKYLERLDKFVERKLRILIPDRFGLVFDGWSMGTEHYMAIFLLWSVGDVVHARLICCGVQDEIEGEDEETTFSAEDIGDYLFDELDLLGRTDVRERVVAATAVGADADATTLATTLTQIRSCLGPSTWELSGSSLLRC